MGIRELIIALKHGNWTLFLDRDGVINERRPGAYVTQWEEFRFKAGVLEAIPTLNQLFARILIVTNQQGIGKGLMSAQDLQLIHETMLKTIASHGGRIDKIYHCPSLKTDESNCRKPDPAMASQAKLEFPEIDFSNSLMVGDTVTDIGFGKKLGMQTAWIQSPGSRWSETAFVPEFRFSGLMEMTKALTEHA